MIGVALVFAVIVGMWVFSPTDVVVTGVGNVSVPATNATFNVTVSASNDSSGDSLKTLRAKVDAIKKKLADTGVGTENITETPVTLTPAAAIVASAKGYQALTTLTVKMSNVAAASDIVVSMYESGATVVSQPVVSVEDQDKLEKQALRDALSKAKQSLSDTVGFRPIRKIVGIQQASSGNIATSTKTTADNSGEFEVTKAVSVTYRVW